MRSHLLFAVYECILDSTSFNVKERHQQFLCQHFDNREMMAEID